MVRDLSERIALPADRAADIRCEGTASDRAAQGSLTQWRFVLRAREQFASTRAFNV
jgi:hypothetical protein